MPKVVAKPTWLLSKAYLWSRSILALDPHDVIFALYPKTGSTWVRIFLFHYLSDCQRSNFSFDELDAELPEFANHSMFVPWRFERSPRIIKTHQRYYPFFSKQRALVLIRNPFDTLVSYYHYLSARRNHPFEGTFSELVYDRQHGLEAYFKFYKSWVKRADMVLKFEDLKCQPTLEFSKILDFLGLELDEAKVDMALRMSTIDRTRAAQKSSRGKIKEEFENDFNFARKGEVGDGSSLADHDMQNYYCGLKNKYSFEFYS